LPELIDIIIEEKAKLFVSAVGIPPDWVIDRLHKAGIPVMNMIGAPKVRFQRIFAQVSDNITACSQMFKRGRRYYLRTRRRRRRPHWRCCEQHTDSQGCRSLQGR